MTWKIAFVGLHLDRLFHLRAPRGEGLCWFIQLILEPAPSFGLAPGVLLFLLVSMLLHILFPMLSPTTYWSAPPPRNLPETCGFLLQAPLMPWTLRSKIACPIASHSRPFSASGGWIPWGRVLCHSPLCFWCQAELGFGVNGGCKENGLILPSRLHGVRVGLGLELIVGARRMAWFSPVDCME